MPYWRDIEYPIVGLLTTLFLGVRYNNGSSLNLNMYSGIIIVLISILPRVLFCYISFRGVLYDIIEGVWDKIYLVLFPIGSIIFVCSLLNIISFIPLITLVLLLLLYLDEKYYINLRKNKLLGWVYIWLYI